MKNYEEYRVMVLGWADDDARLVRERNETRSKWDKIRWRTISKWVLSEKQGQNEIMKRKLHVLYTRNVKELTPNVIEKAPDDPRIAVSM